MCSVSRSLKTILRFLSFNFLFLLPVLEQTSDLKCKITSNCLALKRWTTVYSICQGGETNTDSQLSLYTYTVYGTVQPPEKYNPSSTWNKKEQHFPTH